MKQFNMHIRVTKEFTFEMAHALHGHDGPCKNIHGHSYRLSVTLKGKPVDDPENPKTGMVLDFSEIKELVRNEIIFPFDHSLVLNKNVPESVYAGLHDHKLILVDFQPTCENMLIYFSERLRKLLPSSVKFHHLSLRETNTSLAEWYAEDNE
ncbi:MAG TPA: 6-carboxytetrahydropterin synthase [Bacteroidia bacterium]|nr:6-carboxytetrahydropterin synthase [Bacteroidia bacterium]